MEFIIYVILVSAITGIGYVVQKREVNKYAKFVEEDAPEPAFNMPSISDLRSNPQVLESLRGKVVSIGYNPRVETYTQGRNEVFVEESFLVDSNGAIQTIEKSRTTGASTQVEENARWLANALDVDFVT